MKRWLIVTLGIGIGWIIGITVSMISMPFMNNKAYLISFSEAMGNTLLFGFPGFILLMIAIILSLRDDVVDPYSGEF